MPILHLTPLMTIGYAKKPLEHPLNRQKSTVSSAHCEITNTNKQLPASGLRSDFKLSLKRPIGRSTGYTKNGQELHFSNFRIML